MASINPARASSDPWESVKSTQNLKWYTPNIDHKITPQVRKLLETYSNIQPDDVSRHVHEIRDQAWAIRPYPCTGLGSFLTPLIAKSPIYPTILSRLGNGASLLDVGCFLGQDLRQMVFDGAPSHNLYGVDIVDHWSLGYKFSCDADRFTATFIECDVLAPNDKLRALFGKIDIICATHVLHQWEWEGQIAAAKQLVAFSRPGTIIAGHQIGTSGRASKEKPQEGAVSWMKQDPATWREMWEEVGRATGTEWRRAKLNSRLFRSVGIMMNLPPSLERIRGSLNLLFIEFNELIVQRILS